MSRSDRRYLTFKNLLNACRVIDFGIERYVREWVHQTDCELPTARRLSVPGGCTCGLDELLGLLREIAAEADVQNPTEGERT